MADSAPSTPASRRAGLGLGLAVGLVVGLLVGVVVGALLGAGIALRATKARVPSHGPVAAAPADVDHPETLKSPSFTLQMPGNWRVASEEEDFDPDAYFTIDSSGDSFVTIELIDEAIAVDDEVRQCVADYVPEWIARPSKRAFTDWGAYKGLGVELTGTTSDGYEGGARIFAHSSDQGSFIVLEVYYADELPQVAPGFELIRKTFQHRKQAGGKSSAA